ncbi:MAG: carboxymuconolactone decarboxylase [Alphaproteobacteria bacterium HGW-Alphaproteobacteria-2]|nr:MAG: carboxymuconolactone decarboxylase [Alphaproteobacteria bacterium HGW-Alphaproteobacteria-2]
MSRVCPITPSELPRDLAQIFETYAHAYGHFHNQAAALAHVPPALRHLAGLLIDLRAQATLRRRHLELAVVTVSKLNACSYCIAHHAPVLEVEGLSAEGVARLPVFADHPELDAVDRLVVAYATQVTTDARRVSDATFAALRTHFSEAEIVELTLRIALCGFFNRFNDALRIEIEPELLPEAAAPATLATQA